MSANIETAASDFLKEAPRRLTPGGLPDFRRRPEYFDGDEIHATRKALENAKSLGWREAVESAFGADSTFARYVIDESRQCWIDLLELREGMRVLEIGTGLGQGTVAMAKRGARVCGLEVVSEQADFVSERLRQEGVQDGAVVCGGDDGGFPFRSSSFDVVAANLVFEWCASRDGSGKPEDTQRRFLAECARVLRPGGRLYLSTKNRLSLAYVLGGRDEHANNLRWAGLLGGSLGRGLQRACGFEPSRARLYTPETLRTMIAGTGFEEVERYFALPDARYPSAYVSERSPDAEASLRDARAIARLPRRVRWATRALPGSLLRSTAASNVFLARKGEGEAK
jgi:SAM-dependent methyltransferase